ncbi:MAG: hypothetical protein ACI8WT_000110 [Clostridium sp.]|jgi:hypothetical protein
MSKSVHWNILHKIINIPASIILILGYKSLPRLHIININTYVCNINPYIPLTNKIQA